MLKYSLDSATLYDGYFVQKMKHRVPRTPSIIGSWSRGLSVPEGSKRGVSSNGPENRRSGLPAFRRIS